MNATRRPASLPPSRFFGPRKLNIAAEMFRFIQVGALGYVANVVVFYGLRHVHLSTDSALLIAFGCAASLTWGLNRRYTFRNRPRAEPVRQWLRFLAVNAVGGLIYVGAFTFLTSLAQPLSELPALSILLSAGIAFLANFTLSSLLVFNTALSQKTQCDSLR